jgi:hypothetical protein
MPDGVERNITADRKDKASTTITHGTFFSCLKIYNIIFQKCNIKGQP